MLSATNIAFGRFEIYHTDNLTGTGNSHCLRWRSSAETAWAWQSLLHLPEQRTIDANKIDLMNVRYEQLYLVNILVPSIVLNRLVVLRPMFRKQRKSRVRDDCCGRTRLSFQLFRYANDSGAGPHLKVSEINWMFIQNGINIIRIDGERLDRHHADGLTTVA